ncbi:MAG: SpaA isopeptide-forming pilin-related protein [Thermomicrobiales bacterium]|nr:SpaA isopeptide-forming pilin-related protein [Thermomicrobiales bacterium]
MLRKLRRSCRITHKGLHAPQLMIALTLMLMLSGLMAPIASTIEAAPAAANSSQTEELASQVLQPTPTSETTLLRPSTSRQVQQLQPLQPIDTDEPDDEDQNGDDQNQNQDQNDDQDQDVDEPTTPMEQPAGIIVNLYWCDESVDLQNAPINDFAMGESLKTSCNAQAAPVTVRISSTTNSSLPMESTVNQFPGTAEFSPLLQDTWTINVMPKVVVTQDLFNCNGLTPYGNTKPYATYARIIQDKPQYDMDLLNEEVITCDWFGQVPDTSSLNITKWNCPEGFDFETQGYDVARQTCWDDVNPPVEFTVKNVEPNSTFEEKRQTDPNNNDEVFFPEIPEGALEVTEVVPEGYGLVAVYCSVNANLANLVELSQADMFALKANGGDAIRCDVFDTLGASSGTMGRPMSMDDTGVSITIYKWECLPGTDPNMGEHSYFSAQCEMEKAGVGFQVIDANGSQSTTSDTNGRQIDGLVPDANGMIQIVEDFVSGYQPPVAFCGELSDDPAAKMMVLDRGIAVFPSAADVQIQCWFYNIPIQMTPQGSGTGDIQIKKWDCGNAFITDSSADPNDPNWLSMNCTTPQDGVDFTLNGVTATTVGGYVEFTDLAPGTYDLTETIPDGYAPVSAVCALASNMVDPNDVVYGAAVSVAGGSLNLEVLADHNIYCNWYNKPVGNGDIQITKWDCGAFMPPSDPTATWFATNCTTPMANVTFTVNTTPPTAQATDGSGLTTFADLPEGMYEITETVPDGYQSAAAVCGLASNMVDPIDVVYGGVVNVAGGSLTVEVLADHVVYCNWYNIPTSDFSLTIYKWQCPEGTDATSTDPSYFSGICDTEQAGVPFTIYDGSANSPISTTSDTNGRQIDNLLPDANGQIQIQEDIPTGYGMPVVFCQQLNDNGSTQYTVTNGRVTVAAPYDDDLQCFWYNIPDPGNTVHVTKWECPEGTAQDATIEWLQNNCMTRLAGVDFTLQSGAMSSTLTTDMDGEARFESVPAGMMTLTELIPTGYSPYPIVVCGGTFYQNGAIGDMFPNFVSAPGGSWTFNLTPSQWYIHCDFYNIPQTPSTVEIYKWQCPEGVEPQPNAQWYQDNCTMYMDGVDFTLTDIVGPRTLTTSGGVATFNDVATGPIQIKETIPPGYSNQVFIVCQFTYPDGSMTGKYSPTPVNGVYNTTIDVPGSYFRCDWYNVPVGPGEITVYKWTCPEGYDRTAWGADPMVDCTQATNGVTFRLIQPAPMPELQSDTGDSIPGAVYFGGLEPGTYILNELLTPEQSMNLKEAFVWQCYGLTTSSVQPYPLNVGQMFQFDIVGGDTIVCHWFNVPKTPHGWLDVTKFNCTTEKYVADVYCYTNQTGQEFNLQKQDGANWTTIASGITDVNGKLTFPGLTEGNYRLVEPNKEACLIKSSNIVDGKYIGVKNGEGTTVYVYNCKTPPPPNDKPGKYPNTGVGPDAAASQEQRMPGVELAGLVGLAGMSISRRRFLKRAAGVTLGAGALALPAVAAQDLLPLDSTPVPATPGANILGCGTPMAMPDDAIIEPVEEGTPTWEDPCLRGAVPIRFRVPIIGVDAAVEYLEIIDGQMQPPTGAEDVTWYKETNRLGEVGNGIYAGHLNYWGIPEGVFFRLESLKEGDVIEIDGNDAMTYSYIVQWSQNFPSDEEPPEEALGTTNERAITVITCGGEWVSARAEYDHRTLVRAVQMEDPV